MSMRHDPETIRAEQAEAALVRATHPDRLIAEALDELRKRLEEAKARTGEDYSVTVSTAFGELADRPYRANRWVRPGEHAWWKDCKEIPGGASDDAMRLLVALDDHVAQAEPPAADLRHAAE